MIERSSESHRNLATQMFPGLKYKKVGKCLGGGGTLSLKASQLMFVTVTQPPQGDTEATGDALERELLWPERPQLDFNDSAQQEGESSGSVQAPCLQAGQQFFGPTIFWN